VAALVSRDEALARTLLEALIPIGSRLLPLGGAAFSPVMHTMVALASAGARRGHAPLFCAATLWLEQCKELLLLDPAPLNPHHPQTRDLLDATAQLLAYVADVVAALAHNNTGFLST